MKGGLWLNRQQLKWLVVLLALLPLVPAGLLVRLMVQNAAGDREAAAVELASAYQGQLKQVADRYSLTTSSPSPRELTGLTERVFGEDLKIEISTELRSAADVAKESDPLTSLSYEIGEGAASGWTITLREIPEFSDHREEQEKETLLHGLGILAGVSLVAGCVWFAVNRRLTLDELRTDLVTTVSHELKTPVAASRVLLETLCDGNTDPETTREYLSLLEKENERMGELAEQFLTFARLENGQFEISPVDCQIQALISEQIDLVRPRFESRGGQIVFSERELPSAIKTDPSAVKVIVSNLISNALKYGGAPPEAKVESGVTDHGFWISVSDNGVGVEPEESETIFREFHQADRKLSGSASGMGLGLAISRRFARSLGGDILFRKESDANWSTRFSLVLPLT